MLKSIKRHVLKLRFDYHHAVADYCFGKIDEYDNLNNLYWRDKIGKHVRKEIDIYGRILKLEEA